MESWFSSIGHLDISFLIVELPRTENGGLALDRCAGKGVGNTDLCTVYLDTYTGAGSTESLIRIEAISRHVGT